MWTHPPCRLGIMHTWFQGSDRRAGFSAPPPSPPPSTDQSHRLTTEQNPVFSQRDTKTHPSRSPLCPAWLGSWHIKRETNRKAGNGRWQLSCVHITALKGKAVSLSGRERKGIRLNVDKSAGEDRAGGEGHHWDKEGPRQLHGSLLGLRTYPKEA